MADVRALFTQHFDAARAALTEGDKPAAAECLHWAIAAARSDPSLRRELASALFHLGHLSRKFGRAGEAEAEQLLTEALAISEGLFGMEHAALAPLLDELSRLHVQRAQHARAEDVLQRLLAISRLKGDETADVATVLASLAVVKRKLGDNGSAEALYRDALRIREKVLEPNHLVTIATLEQLSETCAARGNFAEALALLQRALPAREVMLGPGHATVQAARSRAAEFELQVAIAADTAAAAAARAARVPIPTPPWIKETPKSLAEAPPTAASTPINSKDLEFLGEPEPKVLRPAPRSRDRGKTPTVTAAMAAASLMAASIRTPSASQVVISPPESARPHGTGTGRESGAAHRDAVLADVAYGDVASGDAALGGRQSTIAPVQADSAAPAHKKRTVLYASAGVAAVAIAIAGLLMLHPRAGGGNAPVSTEMSAARRTTAVVAPAVTAAAAKTGSNTTGAAVTGDTTRADSLRSASATRAPTAPVVQPEQRAPESARPEFRAPRVEVRLGPTNLPSLPAAINADSILRSAPERPRASDTDRVRTEVGHPLPTAAAVDTATTPPKIIGRAPVPRFPAALLRSIRPEGEVVVRFKVNELGTVDVASMIVVQSDHELFTSAVRDILPRFRFEPARTHAPESKPVAAWVTVPFRFVATK
jgi:TonB family protein